MTCGAGAQKGHRPGGQIPGINLPKKRHTPPYQAPLFLEGNFFSRCLAFFTAVYAKHSVLSKAFAALPCLII